MALVFAALFSAVKVVVCHGDALRDVRFSGVMRSPDTKQDSYRRKIFRGQQIVFPCSDGKMKARIEEDACYAFVFLKGGVNG